MTGELEAGDALGRYTLERRLGGGGFGSVWRAHDEQGNVVALKLLTGRYASEDSGRIRAEVELLAASASASSPHVVRVLGGGIEPWPYVVMEYIEGSDLALELDRRSRLSQQETLAIGLAVADALVALQAAGIIHRDVKPANIMLDSQGVVKLTDFGIAKIVGYDTVTATSQLPMSMTYAAPEVWEGVASHASDVYALGVLLYQCLVGRPPFSGSYAEVYRQHVSRDPDLSLLPEGSVPSLRELVRTSLEKDQQRRPAASQVIDLLTRAQEELRQRALRPEPPVVPLHEPQALGPWLIQAPHPTLPWAFLCVHETSGEKATVEVHFAPDLDYGAQLRKAVVVNPKLVPLGAEKLLGTNRLILRPGEAWHDPPPDDFQFWVARQELPVPLQPRVVTLDLLLRAAESLRSLLAAARAEAITLAIHPQNTYLTSSSQIVHLRPGLDVASGVGDSPADALDFLRALPLDEEAGRLVKDAASLNAIPHHPPESEVGVAKPASDDARQDYQDDDSAILRRALDFPEAPLKAESTRATPESTDSPESPSSTTPKITLPQILGAIPAAVLFWRRPLAQRAAMAIPILALLLGGTALAAYHLGFGRPDVRVVSAEWFIGESDHSGECSGQQVDSALWRQYTCLSLVLQLPEGPHDIGFHWRTPTFSFNEGWPIVCGSGQGNFRCTAVSAGTIQTSHSMLIRSETPGDFVADVMVGGKKVGTVKGKLRAAGSGEEVVAATLTLPSTLTPMLTATPTQESQTATATTRTSSTATITLPTSTVLPTIQLTAAVVSETPIVPTPRISNTPIITSPRNTETPAPSARRVIFSETLPRGSVTDFRPDQDLYGFRLEGFRSSDDVSVQLESGTIFGWSLDLGSGYLVVGLNPNVSAGRQVVLLTVNGDTVSAAFTHNPRLRSLAPNPTPLPHPSPTWGPGGGSIVFADIPTELTDCGSPIPIVVRVALGNGSPVANGSTVMFHANFGDVNPLESSTQNGRATATYISPANWEGKAEITAWAGPMSAMATVHINCGGT